MNSHQHYARRTRQRGTIMIEAMVTMVIAAVGLLGVVGMLLAGIAASRIGAQRTTAVFMANELSDRMCGNPAGVSLSTAGVAYLKTGIDLSDTSSVNSCRYAASNTAPACGAEALAWYDLYQWQRAIKAALPAGTGSVSALLAGKTDAFVIEVGWTDKSDAASYKVRVDP